MSHFELFLPFLQGKTSTAIGRRLEKKLRAAGIDMTQEQLSILSVLWAQDGLGQYEICQLTYKEQSSVTRLLDNMEKSGWVLRTSHPNDRRSNLIFLTRKANDHKRSIQLIAIQTLEESLANISIDDILVCQRVLNQVFANLQE